MYPDHVRGSRTTVTILVFLALISIAGGQSAASPAAGVVTPWLETAMRQSRPDARHLVWVYFRDKGPVAEPGAQAAGDPISARALRRRAARGAAATVGGFEDRPLSTAYVGHVSRIVSRIRHQSRWLNAVSVEATPAQVTVLAALPFVERVDVVRRYRRSRDEVVEPIEPRAGPRATHAGDDPAPEGLDYGFSLEQVAQIGVPELHRRGLSGKGVVVAVFDSGFRNLAHEAFASMQIAAERDFVRGLDGVRDSRDAHGTNTLSVLGGFREGRLVGPAYGATFLLAITENAASETPVEEDNWAAAAEWAEALGADVISSSLGYLEFDLPFTSYTDRDMNGETAVTTKAAAMAAARGMVVVNSAGNGGFSDATNTLGAPADGREVLAVGAVDRLGDRAPFSSVGPTADGRVKPDVAARGVRTAVASAFDPTAYGLANGTSFSCPLVAGVVALLLEARPTLTVAQVVEALRSTASRAADPDNLLGWGIADAVGAAGREFPPEPLPVEGLAAAGPRRRR